ncbi:MAG: PPOX class F420-dependent oxidoreductase [Chloroflexi bacterium]|nr:PPOX class F420-dependent oxidoreductase [Chloroflexota bacterium]
MSDEVEREDAAPAVPPSHRDLLERPLYACLATVREDGAPLANPMWFLWEPGSGVLLFTHTTTRHNYRNVRREPRVAVLISDPEEPLRYLQVHGRVEAITPDPTGAFHEQLQLRYHGRVGEVGEREARVVITVRPTRIVTGQGIRERRHARRAAAARTGTVAPAGGTV